MNKNTDEKLTGPTLLPQSNEIDKAFIFLHGYGSNGDDLISLAPEFTSEKIKNAGFFSPNAPDTTVMSMGFQWFSDNNQTFIDKLGMGKTLVLLENYLTDIHEKYNVSYDKMVLVGFSQGTMMSLYAAPRLKYKIAGVVGFSGRLMWSEELAETEYHKPPIILIHGEMDDVVPVKDSPDAAEKLSKMGFKIEVHTIPHLPHGIDENAINFAKKWLENIF